MHLCLRLILIAFILPKSHCMLEERIPQNCEFIANCRTCVTSTISCDWCVLNHKCTNITAEDCQLNLFVAGENSAKLSQIKGSQYCPSIYPIGNITEILVPSGTTKTIQMNVSEKLRFYVSDDFICQLWFPKNNDFHLLSGKVINGTLDCGENLFHHNSSEPYIIVSLAVVWIGSGLFGGERIYLDNPDNIKIIVYQCGLMADDCESCMAIDKKFGCEWSTETSRCEFQEHLNHGLLGRFDSQQNCMNPEVTTFHPTIEFGTIDKFENITDLREISIVDPKYLTSYPKLGRLSSFEALTVVIIFVVILIISLALILLTYKAYKKKSEISDRTALPGAHVTLITE